jgi:cation diffusion facilitator CzcD-associated flavoprotein CzcO
LSVPFRKERRMVDGFGVVDALIAGAGPAGAATALALAREGWSVRIVEGSAKDAERVGETVPPSIRVPLGERVLDLFVSSKESATCPCR